MNFEMCKRQLISRSANSRRYENSIRERIYLDCDRECEWLDSPRCCTLVLWCLIAFGMYLGIVLIALKMSIASNKLSMHNQFPTKPTVLDIVPIVKCEFDIEDVPFIKTGIESTQR